MNIMFRYIALLSVLLIGLAVEYKFGLVDGIQRYRHRPNVLPVLPLPSLPTVGLPRAESSALPVSNNDWESWRSEQRQWISSQIMGGLSLDPTTVNFQLLKEEVVDGITRSLIHFKSFDGQSIPAYLLIPEGANMAPAVVVVPGHVHPGESGIEQVAVEYDSYQHAAALQLAKAGFVTLTFELRGFGYLGPPEFPEHILTAHTQLQAGDSYKTTILKDTAMAVSLIQGLMVVDSNRIGIAGASLGGEIAVQYGALDGSRIAAISFHSYGGDNGVVKALPVSANQPHYCHIFPVVDAQMNQESWYWLLAPRPVLGIRGSLDQYQFVEQLELYSTGWSGKQDLSMQLETGGHELFVAPTISFFQENL